MTAIYMEKPLFEPLWLGLKSLLAAFLAALTGLLDWWIDRRDQHEVYQFMCREAQAVNRGNEAWSVVLDSELPIEASACEGARPVYSDAAFASAMAKAFEQLNELDESTELKSRGKKRERSRSTHSGSYASDECGASHKPTRRGSRGGKLKKG